MLSVILKNKLNYTTRLYPAQTTITSIALGSLPSPPPPLLLLLQIEIFPHVGTTAIFCHKYYNKISSLWKKIPNMELYSPWPIHHARVIIIFYQNMLETMPYIHKNKLVSSVERSIIFVRTTSGSLARWWRIVVTLWDMGQFGNFIMSQGACQLVFKMYPTHCS